MKEFKTMTGEEIMNTPLPQTNFVVSELANLFETKYDKAFASATISFSKTVSPLNLSEPIPIKLSA